MKGAVRRLMQDCGAFTAVRLANRSKALVMTYHRFSEDGGEGSTSVPTLVAQLEYLAEHYEVVTLGTLANHLDGSGPLPPRLAAITIDDGYRDMYDIALPVLERFRMPATVFVATTFIDGTDWLWTDKVRYAVLNTRSLRLEGEIHGRPVRLVFTDRRSRLDAATRINSVLKTLPESLRRRKVETIAELLDVEIPELAPSDFSPMTWQQLRAMDQTGIEVASHTLTHPILTKVGDERLAEELVDSRRRLEAELGHQVDLFCYPNGDVDARVKLATRWAGYRAAVTTEPGLNGKPCDMLTLRRVHTEPDFARFVQITSGFEQVKHRLRYAVARTAG